MTNRVEIISHKKANLKQGEVFFPNWADFVSLTLNGPEPLKKLKL